MKYVMFEQGGCFVPLIAPDHAVHSCLKMEEARTLSAGHFHIDENGTVRIAKRLADSLDIGPAPGDAEILAAALASTGVYAFFREV